MRGGWEALRQGEGPDLTASVGTVAAPRASCCHFLLDGLSSLWRVVCRPLRENEGR